MLVQEAKDFCDRFDYYDVPCYPGPIVDGTCTIVIQTHAEDKVFKSKREAEDFITEHNGVGLQQRGNHNS
jgi:hypothetical protein